MANNLAELEGQLDPFQAAALRQRMGVRPPKGRKEGLSTLVMERYLPHVLSQLATLPQRALGASQTALETGTYNPGPALEGATLTMGGTPFSAPRGAIGAGPGQFLPKKMDPEMLAAMERAGVKPAQPQGVIGEQARPQQWQQEALAREAQRKKARDDEIARFMENVQRGPFASKGEVTKAIEQVDREFIAKREARRAQALAQAQPRPASPAVHIPRYSKEFVPEIETAGWQKVGEQGGVSPGGFYRTPEGIDYYLKSGPEGHVQAERITRELYGLTGAPVPQTFRAVREGEPAIASKIIPGKTLADLYPRYDIPPDISKEIARHSAADLWLKNTDLHGYNVLIPTEGKPTRIDFGSALNYSPYGERRPYGSGPQDIKWDINDIMEANMYGGKKADMATSARESLLSLPQEEVAKALSATEETKKLIGPALERRREILKHFLPDENINTILAGVASGAGGAAAALDPEMQAILGALQAYQQKKESK